jgi:hypothetical protein
MFLRFRLWCVKHRVARLGRLQDRLHRRFNRLGLRIATLMYRRRFFLNKLVELSEADTLRERLKIRFRRPRRLNGSNEMP